MPVTIPHPTSITKIVKAYAGSEILLNLQANMLICHSFMDADKWHETLGEQLPESLYFVPISQATGTTEQHKEGGMTYVHVANCTAWEDPGALGLLVFQLEYVCAQESMLLSLPTQ